MLVRAVDTKCAVLEVYAARGHGIVVVEELLPLGFIQERLVRYLRSPADIANVYWTRPIEGGGRETRDVNRDWQIRARATCDACHLLDAVTASEKDVVKPSQ